MPALIEALIFVIKSLGSLYLLVVLLRFILQLVRADFYNPISQFAVKATKPLLNPLRKVIPGFGGLDLASLVLALLVQLALLLVVLLLLGTNPLNILSYVLAWSIIGVSVLFVKIFFFALIASVILSWVAPGSYNPAVQLINQICEPLLMPIRRVLPSLGGLDISPIFAFIALQLIDHFVLGRMSDSLAASAINNGLLRPQVIGHLTQFI